MPSPYATSEDSTMLWYEQALNASTHIGAIAFGLHMTVYSLVMYHGFQQKKISWRWLVFNSTLFAMGTINLATCIHFNESAWIDERNYPGGPYAFLVEQQNRAVQTVGNSASVVASTMAEGLLLYRVFMIWDNWYVVVIPALFFLVCTALSIVTVIQLALPFSPTWTGIPSFPFPVWMMLMVLNLLLTFLLAVRLLYMRHKLQSAMGAQYGKTYTSIAAMVVESALPFGIISIVFLVLFGKRDPAQNLFIPLLVQVECISPMLIILRVIRRRAWSGNTVPEAHVSTGLEFAAGAPSSTTEATETHHVSVIEFKQRSEGEIQKEVSGSTVNVV